MSKELVGALVGPLARYGFGYAVHRIVTGLQDLSHEFDDIGDELLGVTFLCMMLKSHL